MPNVVELNNPEALRAEPVQEFFIRALSSSALGELDMVSAVGELIGAITSQNVVIFIGMEDGFIKGLAIVMLPSSGFSPVPQVAHFYNEGSAKLKRELVKTVVDFVQENGYNRFWAINATGRADSVWARTFWRAGKTSKVGSIMEFEIK